MSKAAQHMFISQPALTARIKQIEAHYGVNILIRSYRGIHFTSEGEYLAKQAKSIIKQNEHIKEHVISMNKQFTGKISIGASNYFVKYQLPIILRNLKNNYPNLECHVFTGWGRDILRKLQEGEIDVAFIRGGYQWNGEQKVLFNEKLGVASIHPFEWEDLPYMPRINCYNPGKTFNNLINNWWRETYNLSPLIRLHVDRFETCREMIDNGLGYGIVPTSILKDYSNLYIKILKHISNRPIVLETSIYYYQETLSNSLVKIFIDFIDNMKLKGM